MEENKQHNGEELFDSTLAEIKKRQERAATGQLNCIPLPFERASRGFPGTERGTYNQYIAGTGVGKSQIVRYIHIISVYDFLKNNSQLDIKWKLFYFSLEETKEKFMMSIISHYLYINHKLRVSIKDLRSVGNVGYYLPQDTLDKIEAARDHFKDLSKYVTVHDEIRHPTGFFKTVQEYLETQGHWTYKDIEVGGKPKSIRDKFIHNNEQLYCMCIVDHVGLMSPEKMEDRRLTLHETMGLWSSRYAVELRNKYNAIIIDVQQLNAASQEKQFTIKGTSIIEKLEPSLDGMAGNRETARNADNVFGLFAPDRYQIEEYHGYDILKMQDHFRMLITLKSRDGEANTRVPLYFDGAVNFFRELPSAKDPEMNKVYEKVRRLYE
jgi:hypothetical protein